MDMARLGLSIDSSEVVRSTRDLDRFGKEAKTAGTASEKMGAMSKKGFGMATAAIGAAVGALASLGQAISVIRGFETSMSKVAAITGATTAELAALRDTAKELGSTTEFSASQAADGLTFLGMAGFSAAESIEAIPAVLDLATAAAMDLASSADITSNVLSGFGLAAGDAGVVADVLAAASSSANTSVSQLGGAMSTVAPIAAALDISLQDTAAAIGIMSDAGIQGERAGTALRGVLASLAGPTNQAKDALAGYGLTLADVDPATKSLAEVMETLQGVGLSTADAMTIFGREAASGALVLVEGAQRVGEFAGELRGAQGAAGDMADIMRDNLGGSANAAMSAIQGLALALGEAGLTAIIRGVLDVTAALARGITSAVDAVSGFFTVTNQLALASDTANIAIADEIAQINALTMATGGAVEISHLAALNKLREAEAHLSSAAAKREEAAATLLNSQAYQDTIASIDQSREALRAMRTEGDDLEQMPLRMRDAYEELEQTLVAAYDRQKELLALIPDTSAEYKTAEAAVEDLRRRIEESAGGMVVLKGETSAAADTTGALSRIAGGINFSTAISGAQALADRLGVSLGLAQAIAALTSGANISTPDEVFDPRSPNYNASVQKEANRQAKLAAMRKSFEDQNAAAATAAARAVRVPSGGGGGGGGAGGGGSSVATADPLTDLLREVKLNEDLLGVSEAREKVMRRLGVDAANYSEQEITSVIDRIQAYEDEKNALEEVQSAQQDIADTIENGLTSAIMGAIDGTKSFGDAIKSMAQSVIAELLEVLVVQRLVGSFDSKTKTGSGIVGAIMGSFAGAFDSGGTIPAGKSGIVGEYGPEWVDGPARVTSRVDTAKMMQGGGNMDVRVYVDDDGKWQAKVEQISGGVVANAAPRIQAGAVGQAQASFRNSKQGWSP